MELSPRHRMILKVLIEDFLTDNRPVGSKTLTEKYDLGLSSATIRNVFRELEDLGYINSRHTSGGRVPTEHGYRFYVDSLMNIYELTWKEKQRIQQEYLKNQMKLDQILGATCRVLSMVSSNAAVVLGPEQNLDTLKHIELVHVTGEEILAIIVTRSGSVINRNIFVQENIAQESLYRVSRFLNEQLMGHDLREIKVKVLPDLKKEAFAPEEFYNLADLLTAAFDLEQSEDNLYIDGLKNLWNFQDEDSARLENVLSLLDERKALKEIFSQYIYTDGISIVIGERENGQMSGVSIIATNYKMGEKKIGSIGIIGPQRMNYTKALPLVEFTAKVVSEMITRISK
ncbi:MAG: heat-inducible transcriptional repressor HrcA [Leptospira sp.]|nr:heat-inducible transcriptional repressor HrcA [Leptospira sp.]